MYRIVTHPGNAHKDDFMAVSVLLAILDQAEVLRREATVEDLVDEGTYLIDVGMDHDPVRHNFDHHQDRSLPCAFHLLMQHLGFHDKAQKVFGWYSHLSQMDVRGPHHVAEALGVDIDVLFAASSPIDGFILSRFSDVSVLRPTDALYQLMREFGQDLLTMMAKKARRLEDLEAQAEIVSLGEYKAVVSRIAEEPKLSMELYLNQLNDPAVVMSIFPSNRGSGWELLRLGNNLQVDFRLVAGHEQVRFVHVNGFVAKTRTLMPLEEVLPIATAAICDRTPSVSP